MPRLDEIIVLRATDTLTRDRLVINHNFKVLQDNVDALTVLVGKLNVNSQTSENSFLFPSIQHVDGNALPPSQNTNDIYVLIDLGNGTVDPAWDGAIYNNWVQYNGVEWISIIPKNGYYNHEQSTSTLWYFNGVNWVDAFAAAGASYPTKDDKELIPNNTFGDFQLTGINITNTPIGYITVSVNGQIYTLGDGIKTKSCYFSNDSGVTALYIDTITSGDSLYWNGSIAGINLDSTDRISLSYNIV